jgi:hypothetical protein
VAVNVLRWLVLPTVGLALTLQSWHAVVGCASHDTDPALEPDAACLTHRVLVSASAVRRGLILSRLKATGTCCNADIFLGVPPRHLCLRSYRRLPGGVLEITFVESRDEGPGRRLPHYYFHWLTDGTCDGLY